MQGACELLAGLGVIWNVLLVVKAGEMTFELPDSERMCFHKAIDKGVNCVLEFQVYFSNFD